MGVDGGGEPKRSECERWAQQKKSDWPNNTHFLVDQSHNVCPSSISAKRNRDKRRMLRTQEDTARRGGGWQEILFFFLAFPSPNWWGGEVSKGYCYYAHLYFLLLVLFTLSLIPPPCRVPFFFHSPCLPLGVAEKMCSTWPREFFNGSQITWPCLPGRHAGRQWVDRSRDRIKSVCCDLCSSLGISFVPCWLSRLQCASEWKEGLEEVE